MPFQATSAAALFRRRGVVVEGILGTLVNVELVLYAGLSKASLWAAMPLLTLPLFWA